jgi:FkbM family methyltransferase
MRFQAIVNRPILRSKIERTVEAITGLRFRYNFNLPKLTDRHLHRRALIACGAESSGANGIILDVGAHVGESALAFRESFPQAVIHSFEPISFIFEGLRRNCEPHSNIICHNLAMGDRAGALRIALCGTNALETMNSLNSVATASTPPELTHTVRITRLDDFCAETGINQVAVLKTDVEGFECQVIDGARTLLREGRIAHVAAEVTLDHEDALHTQLATLEEQLREFGYSLSGFYEPSYNSESGQMLYTNALFKSPCLCPSSRIQPPLPRQVPLSVGLT